MLSAEPAPGWTVLEYEPGPDEDVDIALVRDGVVTVIEFFCNNGEPRPIVATDQAGAEPAERPSPTIGPS